ncbi:Pr6Pr family membrane protein [Gordonia insulae]|uniref:FAR-17a/AIG1-like protein n=1 Tax=Gordonia insulae TaxID=2420509 RepID=A0A3G8JTU3_9ACTN|nr:Pr6Pr family membrane protein [Gordonia insulae]AZG48278.1 hypothetical protein D7316_04895 [Gordonia insulae]
MDERRRWARLVRLAFAGLGIAALITQPIQQSRGPGFSLADYLSYFTVVSNIAAVVVLVAGAVSGARGTAWTWLRGATTTAMISTGIFYALLLSDHDVSLYTDWINATMHRILPVYLLIDWVVFRPGRLPARSWLTWLAPVVAFGAYTLIRGAIVGWYPYPFLDPGPNGYAWALRAMLGVLIGVAVVAAVVGLLGRWRQQTTGETVVVVDDDRTSLPG